jgi:hypothetical protein
LGAGGTEISSRFEEYLEIFDGFDADDIEVKSAPPEFIWFSARQQSPPAVLQAFAK